LKGKTGRLPAGQADDDMSTAAPAPACGRARVQLLDGEPLVDFSDRELDLLFADWMRGRLSQTLEVWLGQTERFELANFLGVELRSRAGAAPPLGLPLFYLLLNPRFCVDEPFSGITHKYWTLNVEK
jgi:hypothetical protein